MKACKHEGCTYDAEPNVDYCRGHEGGFMAPFVGRTEAELKDVEARLNGALQAEAACRRERDEARERFDAACAANDGLKRTLTELGCSSVFDGWSNTRALKAEGELLVLHRAARKIAAVVTTNGGDAQLDEHEAKAWREALHGVIAQKAKT